MLNLLSAPKRAMVDSIGNSECTMYIRYFHLLLQLLPQLGHRPHPLATAPQSLSSHTGGRSTAINDHLVGFFNGVPQ